MRTRGFAIAALVVAAFASGIARQPSDDRDVMLDRMRARMYPLRSADVWRVVPEVLKSANLVFPKIVPDSQFAVAWTLQPMTQPKERRSELRVFVSPFAEPARVYVGSIMREPVPDDPRTERTRYNTGELEKAFFEALERTIHQQGELIPVNAGQRAAMAHRLLGATADADRCLARLEADEPPAFDSERGLIAPLKIAESDAPPVYQGGKQRGRGSGEARIDATVTEDGAIMGAHLINAASNDDALADAVLGAASLWHYRPARVGGCSAPVRLTLAIKLSPK